MTIEINDLEAAHAALVEIAKVERAIENAYQPIASSLMVDGKNGVEKYVKERKDALKAYIEAHGNEPVTDGETGVRARLEARKSPATYDIETLLKTKDGSAALIEAGERGYVRIDDKMLSDFRKRSPGATWADAIWRSRMQTGQTSALYIDREAGK